MAGVGRTWGDPGDELGETRVETPEARSHKKKTHEGVGPRRKGNRKLVDTVGPQE